ncbi:MULTISPECIES: creatininase family protein [unclassified Haladaptatus]|uniref:creatininase family protein n=1 Tax=unclassified Haladaptatus TaxID=2622732 RepID=UPI00209C4EAF|nr:MULTISPECIES: creatininase family protein [unclassified Haladaptatus]MCO8246443.1 creatininase family protein [Haladaptatus sp. AB643]MCO8254680.1 creatininase family protein [Haladaptatus sp. AB618]
MTVRLDYEPYDLGGMTWEDAETAIPDADFVVLPTGSVEQHSLHLPVTVDTLRAESLSREIVEAAPDHDLSMVRLPTLPYGYSEHHMNYPGTVTLSGDTYQRVVVEIGESMANHGAERLLVLNCHGGNRAPLTLAADRIQRDHGVKTSFVHWTDFARDRLKERFGEEWGHAGDHETSAIELFYPDLVRTEKKEPQVRKADFEARQYTYFDDITEQGGLGDPTQSDPEFLGEVVAETNADILAALKSDIDQE